MERIKTVTLIIYEPDTVSINEKGDPVSHSGRITYSGPVNGIIIQKIFEIMMLEKQHPLELQFETHSKYIFSIMLIDFNDKKRFNKKAVDTLNKVNKIFDLINEIKPAQINEMSVPGDFLFD